MFNMNNLSLPSVEAANLQKYWDIIRQVEPEFFIIRVLLQQTGVNPLILPKVIRGISNMAQGAGYGKIVIYMRNKKVTSVETAEEDKLDAPSVITREEMRVTITEKFVEGGGK